MDISIIGASGACGREIVIQIVRDRLLERREILQLVASNPESAHPFILHGFRADLQRGAGCRMRAPRVGGRLLEIQLAHIEGFARTRQDYPGKQAHGTHPRVPSFTSVGDDAGRASA